MEAAASANPRSGNPAQFLTFLIAGEEYGIDILNVQEIKGWGPVTRIPNTEDYVLGVINLRGTVVPVVDMRKRFGMDGAAFGPTTVVIVVKLSQHGVDRRVGLVVDAVSEVYQFADDAIQPTPDLVSGTRADFVTGLATVDKKMVILLTVDKLVSFETAGSVAVEAAEAALQRAPDVRREPVERIPVPV